MVDLFYVLLGVFLLFLGGNVLLRGGVSLSYILGVSRFVISSLIIGFGTSMPDLTVSVSAAIKGFVDISLGNVIGSNIANILLILGVSSLITPIHIVDQATNRNMLWLLFASTILVVLMYFNSLNFVAGVLFSSVFFAYIYWSFREEYKRSNSNSSKGSGQDRHHKIIVALFLSVIGIVVIITGSNIMVESAVSIAKKYGISEVTIGLTLVAVGSSLPELATATISAFKKHSDVVLGNIVGSSIFNILAILGVTLLIKPISVSKHMMDIDIWVMLAVSVILGFLVKKRIVIGRGIGFLMITIYVFYIACLYTGL